MNKRQIYSIFVMVGLGMVGGAASAEPINVESRLLALENQVYQAQQSAKQAITGVEALAEVTKQLQDSRQMSIAALNGQKETLQRAAAMLAKAERGDDALDDLRRQVSQLSAGMAQQSAALQKFDVIDQQLREITARVASVSGQYAQQAALLTRLEDINGRVETLAGHLTQSPTPIPSVTSGLGSGISSTAGQLVAVAATSASGPCAALLKGDNQAWQTALNAFGPGMKFISADLTAQLALITSSTGSREAIAAGPVLKANGCI